MTIAAVLTGDLIDSQGVEDYWVVKLNEMGEITWQNTIGGSAIDFLNVLHDMDISIAWDANAGTISFNHTNPVINQELQNNLIEILEGFPGSADGMVGDEDAILDNTFIVLLIEMLESGDSPFG